MEQILSSTRLERLRLKLDRVGTIKTIEFTLERASEVMKASGKKMVNGQMVNAGLSDEDIRCQMQQK